MAAFQNVASFAVNLHAMPCTNHCQHCWTQGSTRNRLVPAEQVFFVLEKLAEVKKHVPQVAFFLYDEPTTHPQFVAIIERASQLGLIWDGFFLPTNGSILARASDEVWLRLKGAGANCLQLTAYGLEQTHDLFAGRPGAFRAIVTTIRRAMEHGMEWYAGVILHDRSVHELVGTVAYLKSLDPTGRSKVGWYPFLWQGRGKHAKRVRGQDYALLPDGWKRDSLVEEREAVDCILTRAELTGQRADEHLCSGVVFQVDRDLRVFCGAACDSAGIAGAVPELREQFALGKLSDEGFMPLLEAYLRKPPRGIELLGQVTWGELAARYGDRTNDEIYHLFDLPQHKWAAAYLLETVGTTR